MPRNILKDTAPKRRGFGFEPQAILASRAAHAGGWDCDIPDAWGPDYFRPGLVMAAGLRTMSVALDRDDLALVSASATFRRTPETGQIHTSVEVHHENDQRIFVHGSLTQRSVPTSEGGVSIDAMFASPRWPGPLLQTSARPDEFAASPWLDTRSSPITPDWLTPGLSENTEWHAATALSQPPEVGARATLWFRFRLAPAATGEPWDPALLPIPGDTLGAAIATVYESPDLPPGCTPLHMNLQVHAPVVGTWLGVEATCTRAGANLVHGVHNLWSETGIHVATITQTSELPFVFTTGPDAPNPLLRQYTAR